MSAVNRQGLSTHFETELRTITIREDDSLTVELLHKPSNRVTVVHTQYMFACDGAHSMVRRHFKVPFMAVHQPMLKCSSSTCTSAVSWTV